MITFCKFNAPNVSILLKNVYLCGVNAANNKQKEMDLFAQTPIQLILFFMLYGGAAVMALILCLYLLLRKGNAIMPAITPPMRLRRWAASFFGIAFLGHLYWFVFYALFGDIHTWAYVVVVVLDCVSLLITLSGTLLAMLQDRRRPAWPFAAGAIPIVMLGGMQIARPDTNFLTPALLYALLLYVSFTIYMVVSVWQYGRWLCDNYADLEHKEVWLSHTLIILCQLLVVVYGFATDGPSFMFIRVADFFLFGFLLWRVETLPQLDSTSAEDAGAASGAEMADGSDALEAGRAIPDQAQPPLQNPVNIDLGHIEQLLAELCVAPQLYLQHDLSLLQLAQAIGTNRSYLSQYFSRQGITYNTYINNLRINHFISRYQEAAAAGQPIVAQQLASESGYRSYSTFSLAFKQRTGQSVTAWIREENK